MVSALTLIGVLAMIFFIICRRVYINYVILNFGCCPLNGYGQGRFGSGCCQRLSVEMQDSNETQETVEMRDLYETQDISEQSFWQKWKNLFGFRNAKKAEEQANDVNRVQRLAENAPGISNEVGLISSFFKLFINNIT